MSTDSAPAKHQSTSERPTAPRKKKKRKVAKPIVRQLTEAEIQAPDRQTLVMLGALAGLSVTLWIFAHAGCNYHPPRETRRPRDVTTAELVREPKDAAIEFQQRLVTLNHAGALEIAAGPQLDVVKKQQAECAAQGAACVARKKTLSSVITTAVVLERTPYNAKVKVTSHNLPGGPKTFLTLVERDPTGWKITSQVPDAPGASFPSPFITPAGEASPFGAAPHGLSAPAAVNSGLPPAAAAKPLRPPVSPAPSPVAPAVPAKPAASAP